LKIARGVQNKVLEALAMGKWVYVSPAVAKTFGATLPEGVVVCDSAADYSHQIAAVAETLGSPDPKIRQSVKSRFSWSHSLDLISAEMELQEQRTTVGG
jgi:hypothetical protein